MNNAENELSNNVEEQEDKLRSRGCQKPNF